MRSRLTYLGGHAGVAGTPTLTRARVASLLLGGLVQVGAVARMHDRGLLEDETVLDQLLHVLP